MSDYKYNNELLPLNQFNIIAREQGLGPEARNFQDFYKKPDNYEKYKYTINYHIKEKDQLFTLPSLNEALSEFEKLLEKPIKLHKDYSLPDYFD